MMTTQSNTQMTDTSNHQQQQHLHSHSHQATKETIPVAKVFVFTRDEYDLIDDWLSYHGELFGPQNLVVVDNGSTDARVHEAYARHVARGVTVLQDLRSIREYSQIMSEHMSRYRSSARFLVPLDTDEFVCANNTTSGGSGGQEPPLTPAEVSARMDAAQARAPDAAIFRFADLLSAVVDPGADDYQRQHHTRPALSMTRFEDQGWDKVYFRADVFVATHAGNHGGNVSRGHQAPCPGLMLLHYHNTGARRRLERCHMSLLGYGHMTPAQLALPPGEQLAVCRALLMRGLIGGHRIQQYAGILKRELVVREFQRVTGGSGSGSCSGRLLPSAQYVADVAALGGAACEGAALDAVRYNLKSPRDFWTSPSPSPPGGVGVDDIVLHDDDGSCGNTTIRTITQVADTLKRNG